MGARGWSGGRGWSEGGGWSEGQGRGGGGGGGGEWGLMLECGVRLECPRSGPSVGLLVHMLPSRDSYRGGGEGGLPPPFENFPPLLNQHKY